MCLSGSVGRGGENSRDDVRTVQLLLQMNTPQATSGIVADGVCGPGTLAAIELYQHAIVGGSDRPGVVTPEAGQDASKGSTLRALRQGMSTGFSATRLQAIYIHAAASVIVRFFVPLIAGMTDAQIDTSLRRSHFLAQVGHESGELRYTEELASGKAYEARKDLGNTQPGDGPRFKGRGLIQLTGRANYAAFGLACGQDLAEGDACSRVATDATLAVRAATWFWQRNHLNTLADQDDLLAITRRVNGGTNGLADRQRLLDRAKWFLEPLVPPRATLPTVHGEADGDDYDLSCADFQVWEI